jgi:hypothetical protein
MAAFLKPVWGYSLRTSQTIMHLHFLRSTGKTILYLMMIYR